MSYKNCDIICCFTGIGRTFYASSGSSSKFALDKDRADGCAAEKFVDGVLTIKQACRHRYILLPLDTEIMNVFAARKEPYLVVVPREDDWDAWAQRWLKAGDTAEQIATRRDAWDYLGDIMATQRNAIMLTADQWIGNILDQNPKRADV